MRICCPKILKRKWFLFSLLVISLTGFIYFKQSKKNSTNDLKKYIVTSQDLQELVTASGKITAETSATLRFQTAGQLAWVGVKKGDYVSKWQAIASLDQRQLEKSFKQELIDYQTNRITFDGSLKENDDQIINRNYLDIQTSNDQDFSLMRLLQKNQLSLDRSVLDVEIANIAKQYAHLYSPIDGIVIEATDVNPGVNISLTTTKYLIVDPNSLRFTAQVDESDIGRVMEGLRAIINLDAYPDEDLETYVAEIEFSGTQSTSGNTVFIINLPLNINGKYRLEMNGDVKIITSEKQNVISVPIDAVEEIDDKKYVTLPLEDNKTQKVLITTGLETDDYYEVISGLNLGDTILIPQ